ncbi:glycosyl hydrolase family 18 protein [Kribbella pittospori]|uniref:glycosyl hydrolase family 18 protein n=1 Tax=Kribbella pittospori TaxID=722689 RepID=UPI001EE06A23|nr:glycosyl hydrolase family 18 protein [Kribbella pittospori]
MRAPWLAVVVGVLLAGITAPAQAANILSNPGFETGSLSGWTCSRGSVVTNPVRSGSHALNGAVTSSDFAQCSQTVSVQPSATYTCSSHTYAVAAYNSVGESAKSAATTGTTGGCASTGLPKHALIGYLHASFANGSGYVRMADVPSEWNIINLSFGEPTSVTSGDIRFNRCPASECPNVESEPEFIAAIRAKQAAGKKVLISIGGANGQVQLTSTAARDAFVSSVSAIIDRYGLDGLDIDFEGHSLYLNSGDTDFRNPTTPVIVNLISALKTLKSRYGANFVLTMAPETFFVQVGYQFYGGAAPVRPSPDCGRTRSGSGFRRRSAQATATPPRQPFIKRWTAW